MSASLSGKPKWAAVVSKAEANMNIDPIVKSEPVMDDASELDVDDSGFGEEIKVDPMLLSFLLKQSGYTLHSAKKTLEQQVYKVQKQIKNNHIVITIDGKTHTCQFRYVGQRMSKEGYDNFEPIVDDEVAGMNLNSAIEVSLTFAGRRYDTIKLDLDSIFDLDQVQEDVYQTPFPFFRICLRNQCIEIMDFKFLRLHERSLTMQDLSFPCEIKPSDYALSEKEHNDKLDIEKSKFVQWTSKRQAELSWMAKNPDHIADFSP